MADPLLQARVKAAVAVTLALAAIAPPVTPKEVTPPPAVVVAPPAKKAEVKPDPKKATGKLQCSKYDPVTKITRSWGGTATVVGPRRTDGKWDVLTANHVVQGTEEATLKVDGRTLTVVVKARDLTSDVAWCVTNDARIENLPYALLAKKAPAVGTTVWHCGFGIYTPGVWEKGKVKGYNSDGWLSTSLIVDQGDSGSGIFDKDGLLVGVVCTKSHVGPGPSSGNGSGITAVLKLRLKLFRPRQPAPAVPPTPPVKPANVVPPCGKDKCDCGCKDGKPCTCKKNKVAPPTPIPVYPRPLVVPQPLIFPRPMIVPRRNNCPS